MDDAVADHPAWSAARAAQARFGRDLLVACGAHGLDIAWADGPDGEPVPGLFVHLAAPPGAHDAPIEVTVGGRQITAPGTIEVEVDGHAATVPLSAVQSPAPNFEADAGD